jgi:hypothetical protein
MQNLNQGFLENSVIIAAHPDDEILWFSSIMKDVNKVLIVYEDFWAHPELGANRAKAVAELPHADLTSLKIAEAGTYGLADWHNPKLSRYGIAFGSEAIIREVKRQVKSVLPSREQTPDQSVWANYRGNYDKLYVALDAVLSEEMNVFTHNPWGEYGHEEHIQVFRVIDDLRAKKGFKLWMSNYVTNRSLPLAMTYFSASEVQYIKRPTDKIYAEAVADVYRKHDCWTWHNDWKWFDEECFMEAPTHQKNNGEQAHLSPLNVFSI